MRRPVSECMVLPIHRTFATVRVFHGLITATRGEHAEAGACDNSKLPNHAMICIPYDSTLYISGG